MILSKSEEHTVNQMVYLLGADGDFDWKERLTKKARIRAGFSPDWGHYIPALFELACEKCVELGTIRGCQIGL